MTKQVGSILGAVAVVLVVAVAATFFVLKLFYPCLGEADEAGCREFIRKKPPYENVVLGNSALFASSRHWPARPIEWLAQHDKSIQFVDNPPAALSAATQITVLIHGFRGIDTEVAAYFDELTNYLAANQRDGAVVVFDWPSTARAWEGLSAYEKKLYRDLMDHPQGTYPDNKPPGSLPQPPGSGAHTELYYVLLWEQSAYDTDKKAARAIGAPSLTALVNELAKLNSHARINIVAHSMGCYVVAQALEADPALANEIRKVIWLAPDVGDDVFERAGMRASLAKIESLDVFYSRDDGALKWPSRLANGQLPLGAYGPRDGSNVPRNVTMHNLTVALAPLVPGHTEKDDPESRFGDVAIHTAFFKTASGVPGMVASLLQANGPPNPP
jgi:pimeloyl-ACP methyl ester carboxylesterase